MIKFNQDDPVQTYNLPSLQFQGKVVGKASLGIAPLYIVECTDGTLPNETYPYTHCVIPEGHLELVFSVGEAVL